jgi:hypothetical protein
LVADGIAYTLPADLVPVEALVPGINPVEEEEPLKPCLGED